MTENNKPEWFQIAESDGEVRPVKVRRTLPVAAVLAATLIIGVGAVVAQTQEESPAHADETTSIAQDQVAGASTTPSPSTQGSTGTTVESQPSAVASPTSSGLANPNIAKLPTGGEHQGGEREHHEGGEHGFRPPHDENEEHPFEGPND